MFKKIQIAIELQIPFILSVDMDGSSIANFSGTKAHYITVLGYINEPGGNISLLCISYGQYHLYSLDEVYESSAQLDKTNKRTFYKKPGQMWDTLCGPLPVDAKKCELPSMDLQHIKQKMVCIYPCELENKFDPILKQEFSFEKFQQAVKHYVAYKDSFFLRWFKSSNESLAAFRQMKEAKTDAERFAIAKAYISANPERQLAKNLSEVMPALTYR